MPVFAPRFKIARKVLANLTQVASARPAAHKETLKLVNLGVIKKAEKGRATIYVLK